METTREILNPEIFSKTYQKDFPYPKNVYWDIFGGPPEGKEVNLLPNAEKTLEDALKTIVPQGEESYWNVLSTQLITKIFMFRYKENMTLKEILENCGDLPDEIEKNENSIQRIIAKTLRLLRHPSRSRNLKNKLELL